MQLFGTVMRGLATILELRQARHQVLLENVANADTPGYRARDLDFQGALRAAFEPPPRDPAARAAAEAAGAAHASVTVSATPVDLDTEMARLSENAFSIVALSRLLARRYEGLRNAIEGGSR